MSRQDRFVTLDGMRGLAALVVAGSHVSELVGLGVPPHAHLAVDFFFVLSGFVIAHAYERRLTTTMRPLDFLRSRVIRLHPLILLGSFVGLIAPLAGILTGDGPSGAVLLWAAAAGILMIPTHAGAWPAAFPLDGPAWSLFAEYAVNILFAVIAVSLTAARLRLLLIAGVAMLLLLALGPAGLGSYWRVELVGLSLLRVVYPFFAGVLINRLHRSGALHVPSISAWMSISILLAILLAPSTGFDTLFQLVMIVALFPLLVAASVSDRLTALQSNWMLTGGSLSYPIYMLHFPIAVLIVPFAITVLPPIAALAAILLSVIGSSSVALRYFDEPARAWLGSRERTRRQRALPA